jgi:hypothetical protein
VFACGSLLTIQKQRAAGSKTCGFFFGLKENVTICGFFVAWRRYTLKKEMRPMGSGLDGGEAEHEMNEKEGCLDNPCNQGESTHGQNICF